MPALLTAVASACGAFRVASAAVTAGDCYVAVRKGGKKFAHYDLTLRVTWERVEGGEGDGGSGGKGDLTLSEWSSDGDAADVLLDGDADAAAALRDVLLAALEPFGGELEAIEF